MTQSTDERLWWRPSSKWLPTTAQIPYLSLPLQAHQPTAPAFSFSASLNAPNNRRNQATPTLFGDNGKEANNRAIGSKQYSGLPNRIEETEKNTLRKFEGASTVSVADNDEIQGHLSDNVLEEFYRTPMSFGTDNLTLVTTQVGATAFLPCRVHYIGDGVVSSGAVGQGHTMVVTKPRARSPIRRSRGSGGRIIIY